MYNNYIFDLYGTLIDINTDEWNDDLWKKIAILYAYKGAHYTYDELNEEYDRLVQAEKKAVLKKSPDTKVVDIKIEKVFRKLFAQKGVKVTKAEVLFIAEAFRWYLIFSTLSRQKAKRFIFSLTHSVHSQKMS